ncbi:MAG: S24 family peptidase [Campylobacter sp.]|nr:S24 family peptidase [Campylobacter sp.]
MQPRLSSGDWVIIDISSKFNGDDLYVINFRNIFMAKMLQIKPNGNFFIKSLNPAFDSFEITEETQEFFDVVGRVVKTIS